MMDLNLDGSISDILAMKSHYSGSRIHWHEWVREASLWNLQKLQQLDAIRND